MSAASLSKSSKVAVAVANREIVDGFRFIGTPKMQDSGELFDQTVAFSEKMECVNHLLW